MRYTPAALMLYAAGAAAVVAAIAVRSPLPVFFALPLLLAPLAALLDAPAGAEPAQIEWRDSGEGPSVEIAGRLRPPPGAAAESLTVRWHRPELLTEVSPPSEVVRSGGIDFAVHWRAPYPCVLPVAWPTVAWTDPLGLADSPLVLRGEPMRVERFPPEAERIGRVRLHRTTTQPGEVRSRALGGAGEFFGVRLAVPGDSLRQVNWSATARTGALHANDFRVERTGDLLILLDLRPTSLGPARDEELSLLSRAAALGIARGFLAEKSRVGLGVYDEFLDVVPMGTGRTQTYRIRQLLSRPRAPVAPGPPERLAVSARRYFAPGVTTLLITPLVEEEAALLVSHLRRRGFPSVILSPSPLPLLAPKVTLPVDQVAQRLMRLVRRDRLARAWQEAPVVDWTEYWTLDALVRLLRVPARAPEAA